MNQLSLFGERDRDGEEKAYVVGAADVIADEAEVRELAREYFSLPTPSDADPPLLKAKREQAAREAGAHLREMVAKWAPYETAKGHISIHDPVNGEWHDVVYKGAPNLPIILYFPSTPNVATTKTEHGKARPAKGSKMERGQSV
jgi:hypothetical protein